MEQKIFTEWEKGWISGLLDSDGGVYFNRSRGGKPFITCRIQFDSSSKDLAYKLHNTFGCGFVSEYRKTHTKGLLGNSFKPMYRVIAGSNAARWVLPQLTLVAKKRQQEIILEVLPLLERGRWKTTEQNKKVEELFYEMRRINMKGTDLSKTELKRA